MQLQDIIQSTQCCISDLKDWMTNNKLELNEDKTDMILISSRKVLNNTPLPSEICLNGTNIKLCQTVRNIRVSLDQTLSFHEHVLDVCHICHLELRRISTTRHSLSEDATKTLICAFVLSRLDYCNGVLSGSPPPKTILKGIKKFKTMLLGSSTGRPNSIMSHLFSTPR